MQMLSADDAAVSRSIRRAASPETSAEGFGAFWARDLRTPTEGNVVGLDGNEYGGFGAFAWDLSDSWVAGFDLGYSAFTGNLDRGYGNTRIGTLRGGGFATWSNGNGLFLDGALSAAWNHYDFTRIVPDTNLFANSNADGWQIDTSIGAGYRMELQEGFAFTPMASFLYSYINTGSIDENSDTIAALSIDPGTLSSFIGRVGAGVSWSVLPGIVIDGEAGWQGNFTDNGDYSVGLSGLGADVPVEVRNQTINTAYYGAGVSWAPSSNIELNLNWQGRSGDGLLSNMFYGGVSISF
jgi:outer membrane autotransporter protein